MKPIKHVSRRHSSRYLQTILQRLKRLFVDDYRVLFFISFAIVLLYALVSLNITLAQPSDSDYRLEQERLNSPAKFDQATIDRINRLNSLAPLPDDYNPPSPFAP